MTIPTEAAEVIVRLTAMSKEDTFWLMNEMWPEVSDEELEQFWSNRKGRVQ
jgi:predicted CopG family antitoxin